MYNEEEIQQLGDSKELLAIETLHEGKKKKKKKTFERREPKQVIREKKKKKRGERT